MTLKDLLENRNCFKLVCGAGNENAVQVEELVKIYYAAGCRFFDVSANLEVVNAAKRVMGVDSYLCVSISAKGDPHITKAKDLEKILLLGIDCIELHAACEDEGEAIGKWQWLNENFDGMLSICLGRGRLGDSQLIGRIKKMLEYRALYTTIVQADGFPMSGGADDYKSTLQAVAAAQIVQNANLPVYLLLSGGTNSKTAELARLCGVAPHGIAVGSYARQIAHSSAKKLVDSVAVF
ncbi:MAG: hypothetical protein LBJ74_01445 [Heliobacteriaceae bacterium]|jgi:hypothetical protein|nr:hypothetical protein [Heliobacteriaceae bacterium]